MKSKLILTAALVCVTLYAPLALFSQSQDFEMNGTVLVKYNGNAADVTIPAGVTAIGRYAFNSCRSLTSVTIPSRSFTYYTNSFSGCDNLKTVVLPRGSNMAENGVFPSTTLITYTD